MRTSFYNYELQEGDFLILYNAATDEVLILRPETAKLYSQYKNEPQKIENHHSELYQYLYNKRFIVSDDTNEVKEIIKEWEEAENSEQTFALTINPTLDCNMKCWYCYEKHEHSMYMNESVRNSIIKLIERQVISGKFKRIAISFFGGEPLLNYQKGVWPIINKTDIACKKSNIKSTFHFTTNGFLLNDNIFHELENYDVSFQIPIDGNERLHNSIKRVGNSNGTYRHTINNIKKALKHGFKVGVRFNYTAHFLPVFIDVLSDFQNLEKQEKGLINFDFQQIWQDSKNGGKETLEILHQLIKTYQEEGFYVNSEENRSTAFCYADKKNHITINYDGNLFHCTARDFSANYAEGSLESDGTLKLNERHIRRMAIRYGNNTCHQCRAYPICHGGCTQHKLEYNKTTGCLKGFSTKQQEELLRKRLLWIIEEKNKFINKQ